jgi:hypothetical protein
MKGKGKGRGLLWVGETGAGGGGECLPEVQGEAAVLRTQPLQRHPQVVHQVQGDPPKLLA